MVTQNTIIPDSRVASLGGYKGAATKGVGILVWLKIVGYLIVKLYTKPTGKDATQLIITLLMEEQYDNYNILYTRNQVIRQPHERGSIAYLRAQIMKLW